MCVPPNRTRTLSTHLTGPSTDRLVHTVVLRSLGSLMIYVHVSTLLPTHTIQFLNTCAVYFILVIGSSACCYRSWWTSTSHTAFLSSAQNLCQRANPRYQSKITILQKKSSTICFHFTEKLKQDHPPVTHPPSCAVDDRKEPFNENHCRNMMQL